MDEYESYKTELDEAAIDMYWFSEDLGHGVLPVVGWKRRREENSDDKEQ